MTGPTLTHLHIYALSIKTRIAGLEFALNTGEGDHTSRFLELWHDLFASQSSISASNDATVHLTQVRDSSTAIPIPDAAEPITDPEETAVFRSDREFWYRTRGMVCHVVSGNADIAFDPSFWTLTLFDQRNFLLVAIVAVLRQNNVFPFHGNGLIKDGTGIILTGNSGAGKTTLTHSLINSGWRFLADDAIAMRSSDSGLDAWALRRGFALTVNALERTTPPPLWDANCLKELGNGKFLAMPTAEVQRQFTSSCRPSAIFFSQVGDTDETVIEKIPDHVALMSTFEQAAALLADPDLTASNLSVLSDLINQCACYKIVAGRDVISGGARAEAVSERILMAARTGHADNG